MQAWLAVGAGGAIGALGRYAMVLAAARLFGPDFPAGTMLVNVLGSLAMGILVGLGMSLWTGGAEIRLFLAVGLLGSFTTFSTFSLDVIVLFERRLYGSMLVYGAGSVLLSLAALSLGLWLGRRFCGDTML